MNEIYLLNKYNLILNCIIDMLFFLIGEIYNIENIFYRDFYWNNFIFIFCFKVFWNILYDNLRCFNLILFKYRFYLYCNLR